MTFCRRSIAALCGVVMTAAVASAHNVAERATSPGPRNWTELAGSWSFEWGVVVPLVVTAVLYVLGVRSMWRSAGVGRGLRVGMVVAFALGMLALVAALVSPVH